jgi:mercuric ion transport protein
MKERTAGFSLLGIAAACAACCVGPILALLGGLSVAGLASALVFGTVGIVVAVGAAVAALLVVRRRSSSRGTEPAAVPVAPPSRR